MLDYPAKVTKGCT